MNRHRLAPPQIENPGEDGPPVLVAGLQELTLRHGGQRAGDHAARLGMGAPLMRPHPGASSRTAHPASVPSAVSRSTTACGPLDRLAATSGVERNHSTLAPRAVIPGQWARGRDAVTCSTPPAATPCPNCLASARRASPSRRGYGPRRSRRAERQWDRQAGSGTAERGRRAERRRAVHRLSTPGPLTRCCSTPNAAGRRQTTAPSPVFRRNVFRYVKPLSP